jgi:transcriptional regulator with XRE-family HTH domain
LSRLKTKKLLLLKSNLAKAGVTSKALADHLGKHPNLISRWNQNTKYPGLEELYKIAAFLNIPLCDLFVDENPFIED